MSLESLFQHIIFTEHQAEESRRVMREGQVFLPGPLAFVFWSWLGAWSRRGTPQDSERSEP
jgi:hypothetical protein